MRLSFRTTTGGRLRFRHFSPLVAVAILSVASVATAHDFWIIPDMFAFAGDATVHVIGRSGTGFPAGTAVQPARVADARIIGASSDTKITEMSVEGTALRLHQKPSAAGQYLVALALTPRTTRSTPAGLLRYLRAEGGGAEAARLERESALTGFDSLVYTGGSFASTLVQVGQDGPRAFSRTAGFPLEFVPVADPSHLHVGDTLHVKVVGNAKAVAGIGIDAVPAADSTAAPASMKAQSLTADANGIVHLPLTKAGPWMLRSAYVGRHAGGAANEWDVSRTTFVFNVGASHH